MTRFMVLYRSAVTARDQMAAASPEQTKAGMEAWMAWASEAGDAIVDLGSPLASAADVGPGSSDGAIEQVVGFSVLQAESVDAVTSLLKKHPHLHMDAASIEVFEFLPMPG
jgi:hypothetical protein